MAVVIRGGGCFRLSVILMIMLSATSLVRSAVCPNAIIQATDAGQSTTVVAWPLQTNYTCDSAPDTRFPIGATVVECTDGRDNSTCSFSVTVRDDESPTVSCPGPFDVNTDSGIATGRADWSVPLGSDNVGVTSRQCDRTSGSSFNIGVTRVKCTVRDSARNQATCEIRVTVTDNEPPVFIKCRDKPIRSTTSGFDSLNPVAPVQVTWDAPAANDNSGGPVTLSSTYQSGDEFQLGVTRVTYTATDDHGNAASSCFFNVQVVVQPPSHVFTENLSTTSAGNSCMTVVWPESENGVVKEYAIAYWKQGTSRSDSSQRIAVKPQGQPDITFTYNRHVICSLSPGELYTVQVGEESGNTIASIEQWTVPATPGTVTVTPGTRSSVSVELSWERVSLQNLEQYRVYLNGGRNLGYVTKTTDRLVVDSLLPGGQYTAYVRAVVGSGTKRLESQARTLTINTDLLSESELLAYNYTESTITVAWRVTSATRSNRDPYMLYIEPEHADENYLTVFNPRGNTAKAEFKGLKPNTEYQIRLVSNLGLSLGTSQKTRPGRVGNIRPTEVLNNSITLQWKPPAEGYVDSYEVYISPGDDPEPITVSSTSYHFSSLTAQTEYFFRIASVYEGIKSVPQTLLVTAGVTKAAAPSAANSAAIVLGTILGSLALVLLVGIVLLFLKYQKLKNSKASKSRIIKANTRNADSPVQNVDKSRRHQTTGPEANVEYELVSAGTLPDRIAPSAPVYQNAAVGRKPKQPVLVPKFKSRRDEKSDEGSAYAVANING